jgi:hypothetical protein
MDIAAIIIEAVVDDDCAPSRRTYEVEEPSGDERRQSVIEGLMARVYPDAVLSSYADGAAIFDRGRQRIVARWLAPSLPSVATPAFGQEQLFAH